MSDFMKNINRAYYAVAGIIVAAAVVWAAFALHSDGLL
jgi:hypothetical protein